VEEKEQAMSEKTKNIWKKSMKRENVPAKIAKRF
jgi:hypothetical protein